MEKTKGGKRARLSVITVAAAVLAVALLALVPQGPSVERSQLGYSLPRIQLAVNPAGVPANQFDINRSQSSGTYVSEWVSLNNSSSLSKLPLITTANGCKWVTVLNLSVKVNTFNFVKPAQVTSGNNTGTIILGLGSTNFPSFKACAGSTYFVDYTLWVYADYIFSAIGLGNSQTTGTIAAKGLANLTLVSQTPTGYAGAKIIFLNQTFAFDVNHAVSILVPTNTSFQVTVPALVTGATTCDITGQICSYPQWTFSSATKVGTTNVSTKNTLTFAQPLTATFNNWTASYTNASIGINTPTGAFFVGVGSFWSTFFVALWWVWIVIILVAVAIAVIVSGHHGRGSR
ncbi:MAG TPA: hypothetical protein VGV89_01605 [Thermoplasmata archaeon]|nr:hypothetical protein [Thermoplasmata archaeon]